MSTFPHPEVTKEDPDEKFEILSILGEGSYGAVYKVVDERHTAYAMKVLHIEDDLPRKKVMSEISVLASCRDSFLVSFVEYLEKDDRIHIVMELCEGGSVYDVMSMGKQKFSEAAIREIMAAALLGLNALHNLNIVHRDVKTANLFLTSRGQVKLGDFGVSAALSSKKKHRKSIAGTPHWLAPEIVLEKPYGLKVDVWALGITLIELAENGKNHLFHFFLMRFVLDPPHSKLEPLSVLRVIPVRKVPRFKRPKQWSGDMNDFLSQCVTKSPANRPSVPDLLNHSFVTHKVNVLSTAKPVGSSVLLKNIVKKALVGMVNFRQLEGYGVSPEEEESSYIAIEAEEKYAPPALTALDSAQLRSFMKNKSKSPFANTFNYRLSEMPEIDDEPRVALTEDEKNLLKELKLECEALNEKYKGELKSLQTFYDEKRAALVEDFFKA